MKIFVLLFALSVSLYSCKSKQEENPSLETPSESEIVVDNISTDTLYFTDRDLEQIRARKQSIKKKELLALPDDKETLQELLTSKFIHKEDDAYILDYTYPYLNEDLDPGFKVFNNYLAESYLNTERTINEILEDKELLCDTLKIDRFREKRIIDYKLHSTTNNIISILLYKENFYSGMKHSAYLFDCLNFDTEKDAFIYFDDVFVEGSDQEIFNLINKTITSEIESGDMYYDCWELSERDFLAYKNNFVINDEAIEFYFDDCVVCPSYTGTYAIKVPVVKLLHLIKYYEFPILG